MCKIQRIYSKFATFPFSPFNKRTSVAHILGVGPINSRDDNCHLVWTYEHEVHSFASATKSKWYLAGLFDLAEADWSKALVRSLNGIPLNIYRMQYSTFPLAVEEHAFQQIVLVLCQLYDRVNGFNASGCRYISQTFEADPQNTNISWTM